VLSTETRLLGALPRGYQFGFEGERKFEDGQELLDLISGAVSCHPNTAFAGILIGGCGERAESYVVNEQHNGVLFQALILIGGCGERAESYVVNEQHNGVLFQALHLHRLGPEPEPGAQQRAATASGELLYPMTKTHPDGAHLRRTQMVRIPRPSEAQPHPDGVCLKTQPHPDGVCLKTQDLPIDPAAP
jgi:hypothetical protein